MIDGARGVGKTTTARQHARTVYDLQDERELARLVEDPHRIWRDERPVLIDEWQNYPQTMNLVKIAVDRDFSPGQFILTGTPSAPSDKTVHSGAGRVVPMRMRPLSLAERGLDATSVSLRSLFDHGLAVLEGETELTRADYLDVLTRSGFPGIFLANRDVQRDLLAGYLQRITDRDLVELPNGPHRVSPQVFGRWLRAYARETSTSTDFEKMRLRAQEGDDEASSGATSRSASIGYRTALENLGVIDELAAWGEPLSPIKRCVADPMHHLVEPALAVTLLSGAWLAERQQYGDLEEVVPDNSLMGRLFQSVVTQSVRVYADGIGAEVYWLRTWKNGDRPVREVDLVVIDRDGRVLGIEVKLARHVTAADCAHLTWLRSQVGSLWADGLVIYTGSRAYRREHDDIGVVPAALLCP